MHALFFAAALGAVLVSVTSAAEIPWQRHTIDGSGRGADGVRIADVNNDGHPDIATGWEESGMIRVYRNPGPVRAKQLWPAVTVGNVGNPEDAVFVDLDNDGHVDVVSCCEGTTQAVYVHWAPVDTTSYMQPDRWQTDCFPQTIQQTRWMFCVPMEIDGKNGIDLVLGSKQPNAVVGWMQSPSNPRDLAAWKWYPLYDAGWIMSLVKADLTGDDREDIVLSDRKGPTRGLVLLEHPGPDNLTGDWPIRRLGGDRHELMFLDYSDAADVGWQIVVATRDNGWLGFTRTGSPSSWTETVFAAASQTGTLKSVRWGDLNCDGRLDLVYSCENAVGGRSGVVWLERPSDTKPWTRHEISGPDGIKFDLLQLLDLDHDGDLDVVTCEERENLGVIWYENPCR